MNSIRKNMNYSPSLLPCHTNVLHNQVWLCSGLILRLHSKLFSSQKLVILSLSLTSNLEASIFTNRKSSQQPKDISTLAFLPFSSSILLKGMYIGRFGILLFDYTRHHPHLLVFDNENLVLAHKKLEEPLARSGYTLVLLYQNWLLPNYTKHSTKLNKNNILNHCCLKFLVKNNKEVPK